MILIFYQYYIREFEISISQVTDILSQIGFFILIMMLFPLTLGPDPNKLSEYGIALVWIAAFVSVVPAYDRLFTDDYLHGFTEKAAHNDQPLGCYAAAKCLCFFLVTTIPLLIILPVICTMIGLNLSIFFELAISLVLGLFGMTLLGGIASGLVLGARRAAILAAVLVLPLSLPIIIFGCMTGIALIETTPIKPYISIMIAMDLSLIVLAIPIMQLGLKNAIENN